MITSKAPGKMILIGEYAVLEGAPALVAALDCFARVSITQNGKAVFSVESPSINIGESAFSVSKDGVVQFNASTKNGNLNRLQLFSVVFEEIYKYLTNKGKVLDPVHIVIETEDFYSDQLQTKYGFGSSAAMTSALTNAILNSVDLYSDLSISDKFFLAYAAHRRGQGNLGSGIDIAASIYGGVLKYQLDRKMNFRPKKPIKMDAMENLFMFPVWAGHSTSTRKMVHGVDELKNQNKNLFDSIMDRLNNCSENAVGYFADKKTSDFLATIQEYNRLLQELGVKSRMPIVSGQHQLLTQLIEREGGYYKPSGAGGGDIGICFFDSGDLGDKLRSIITTNKFEVLPFKIVNEGAGLDTK